MGWKRIHSLNGLEGARSRFASARILMDFLASCQNSAEFVVKLSVKDENFFSLSTPY